MEIAIVLGLLVVAVVAFATEKISVDIITLVLLLALVLSGILTPAEAFAGFSSEIIIILGSIFVISAALQETGVLDAVGARILRVASTSTNRLTALLMGVAAAISAFMNNTTVTAMLIGPVIGISKRARIAPSRLLMPLAYASILGGTCTLIGTSTNVAVSGYLQRMGLEPIGLFEITPIGLVICGVGFAYMILVGKRFLPDSGGETLADTYGIREYMSEVVVLPNSPLVGQRTHESDLSLLDFRIVKILRGTETLIPSSRVFIEENDTLLVEGKVQDLIRIKKIEGIEIKPEFVLGDLDLESANYKILEVLVTPRSELVGGTLRDARFRQRYGLTVLAVYRHGESIHEKIGDLIVQAGDLLLVQGPDNRVELLDTESDLAILDQHGPPTGNVRSGFAALTVFGFAILAGGLDLAPMSIAFLAAALLCVVLRCITIERAYEFIDWRLLILIAGMGAFGTAMEKSGAADFLAHGIVAGLEPFGLTAILAGFFLLTIILTQPMSNAAAALVVLPVAMSAAEHLQASPRTFGIAVMLAASISFIAPFEPSCILVYGPGKYRFMDFVRTGAGLTLVLAVVVLWLLPYFWALR